MKRNRLLVLLLALALLLSGCAGDAAAEPGEASVETAVEQAFVEPEADSAELGLEEEFLYGRSFLSAREREVYDLLRERSAGPDFYAEVSLPVEIDDFAAGRLITYFCYDNPQLYWAVPEMTLNDSGERCLRIAPELAAEELAARAEKLETATASFLEGVGGSDFQVVSAIHDRLVRWVSRDTGSRFADSDNIYGALVDGMAACDGYAKSFQYLLGRLGIPCVYYGGESLMTTRPHAWNAVCIDGEWTYADVTWDALTPGHTPHTYLGITLEEIRRERGFLQDQYPEIIESDSTTYNYYRYRDYAVFPGDGGQPARQMAEALVNQLEDKSIPEAAGKVFLEIKVMGDKEVYRRYRDVFIQDIFLVLREMETIIGERELPICLSTQGEISCNYKDVMQILVLYPEVQEINIPASG